MSSGSAVQGIVADPLVSHRHHALGRAVIEQVLCGPRRSAPMCWRRWRSRTRPTARLTAVGYRAVAPHSGAMAVSIAAAVAFAHGLKRHITITVPIGLERPSAGFPLR